MGIAARRIWQLGARVMSALCSPLIKVVVGLLGSPLWSWWGVGPGAAGGVQVLQGCFSAIQPGLELLSRH